MSEEDSKIELASTLPPCGATTEQKCDITRRAFITAVGAVTGGIALNLSVIDTDIDAAEKRHGDVVVPLELTINGRQHRLSVDPRVTLLDLLREDLGLTGTKK